MKRFQSPLERIQRIAKQRVEMLRLRVGKINAEINSLERKSHDIETQISSTEREMTPNLGAKISTENLQSNYREIERLNKRSQEVKQSIQATTGLKEQELLTLSELQAHEKALEKIMTKRRTEHRKEVLKHSQYEIDEIASRSQSF